MVGWGKWSAYFTEQLLLGVKEAELTHNMASYYMISGDFKSNIINKSLISSNECAPWHCLYWGIIWCFEKPIVQDFTSAEKPRIVDVRSKK